MALQFKQDVLDETTIGEVTGNEEYTVIEGINSELKGQSHPPLVSKQIEELHAG